MVVNEGQRLLREQLKAASMSHQVVAERVGVSRTAARAWAQGHSLPAFRARMALAKHFGISPDAWDRKPVQQRDVAA